MTIDLNAGWELRPEGLEMAAADWPLVERRREGWLSCSLPCDVRMPLIERGIITEPLEGLNCFDSEWVEDRSWWFRKRFSIDDSYRTAAECRLRFEMLDVEADIFLNGRRVGHQRSAFYPFERDVKPFLVNGENVLGVRLTCGLERVKDEDFAGYARCIATEALAGRGTRGDKRRSHLRKPQFVFGWDWGPRVATCAIAGGATLTLVGPARIAAVQAVTSKIEKGSAHLDICVEAENTHPWSTREAVVSVEVREAGPGGAVVARGSSAVLLRSGITFVDFALTVSDAKLWWPNGHGGQPLYVVEAAVADPGSVTPGDRTSQRIGIRTIELDQTPEFGGRRFALVVNGVRLHCKGSDWIPADSLYARVTEEKYRTLIAEAAAANFSMLRIWGGGRYESETFYDACDEAGILLWHDFMFCCAIYPDNEPWFQEEVRREADYQTRRLRHHPCMGLWGGSNENNWGFVDWWNSGVNPEGAPNPQAPFWGGAWTYNHALPRSVRTNCPDIPYWNGSPYGGEHPNSSDAGDCHFWTEATMSRDMAKRVSPEVYDTVEARFVTEYGYIGPCVKSSIEKYHGGAPIDRTGPIYELHNNTFEKETVLAGIATHYRDPVGMTFDEYLLYAGLVQGLMYGYSLESLRSHPRNSGSLFWMYADCWGEVGWTIIDYYLKRKPSWYYVRRAFQPLKLVMRLKTENIEVTGINDTASDFRCDAEYGSMSLDGVHRELKKTALHLPARSRSVVLRFTPGDTRDGRGIDLVRPVGAGDALLPATLRRVPYRQMSLPDPGLEIVGRTPRDGAIELTVRAKRFAHAVHFGLGEDAKASDEYFDLLPGESRTVVATGVSALAKPVAISVR